MALRYEKTKDATDGCPISIRKGKKLVGRIIRLEEKKFYYLPLRERTGDGIFTSIAAIKQSLESNGV